MSVDTKIVEQMLSELHSAASVAQGKTPQSATAAGGADFSQVLKAAIDQVSQAQQQAQQMSEDFASGKEKVNLQDVMVNLQKANLSFQQMVQGRNKLVSAYQNIMNMPV